MRTVIAKLANVEVQSEHNSVKDAKKYYSSQRGIPKLQIGKSVFVPGLGYIALSYKK